MKSGWGIAMCALALSGIGCVAVNIGQPETFTHTQTVLETDAVPSSHEVSAAWGRAAQTGGRVEVSMGAELQEGYARTRYEETVVVRRQKRLAVGLFPGAAERFLMPEGALDSGMAFGRGSHNGAPGQYALYTQEEPYLMEHALGVVMLGIPYVAGTVNSLLFQPFAGWSCKHDYLDKECLKPKGTSRYGVVHLDNSESPAIRGLNRFPAGDRKKIGVTTCFDGPAGTGGGLMAVCTHLGMVGCHKYLAVFVEPARRGPGQIAKVKVQSSKTDVEGPYTAELSIPALGWSRAVRVEKGATRAEFELPAAERRCVAEAVVRFRGDALDAVSDVTRRALEKVAGQEYRFDVTLQGGATAAAAAVPAAAPRAGGGAYEVVGITPSENGQYEVRVRIADKSKTFDIGWAVEPDVKRMIREDFANRHPGTGIQYVREMVEWETEEDGAILVYRGWAFSARPVSDGWTYDTGSRRGTVRLRISEGMPPDEAKRWARENIEAIVKEKNVALEAGTEPPSGAMYRSLGESLEDGVLTVEFEAVE